MQFFWLALLAATGAAALQSQPRAREVLVIVDADAPAASAEGSARLRERVLSDVDRYGRPVYFELTSDRMRPVPEDAADSFRRAVIPFEAPTYGGVSLTFAEAVEILRKNEALRESVIRRECPVSADCGGAVHAAALAVVSDTEAASAKKLRHLVELATSRRGTTMVLVTSGWPYRDEHALKLDASIKDLQAAGNRLVVLRAPARFAYEGLVRDGSERLASRAAGTFIPLRDERDVARARRALAGGDRSASYPAVRAPASAAPRSDDDAPAKPGVLDASLRRAADYVARFETTFSSVIWRERSEQEDRVPRKFGASGTTFSTVAAQRELESELFLVWLPRDANWITVRDVVAIDGKPRPASDRHLQTLLSGQAVSVGQLKRLAAENGRFNVGTIVHTFNEPTLALLFLDEHYRDRFTFARNGEQVLGTQRAARYDFAEIGRPTVIQNRNADVPTRGTLWIDEATGRVLQTALELSETSTRLQGRMTVRYGPHPRFDVLVPVEMREWYTSPAGEEVTTVATYSDFRRFETGARIVPK